MRIALILFFTSFICLSSNGQVDSLPSDSTDKVEDFISIEKLAEFPGGEQGLKKYIRDNLEYPAEALENGISGEVWIQFDIDENGNVENVEVAKSSIKQRQYKLVKKGIFSKKMESVNVVVENYDYCLGTCAVNLISNSPKWEPAMQRDKPVRMRYRVPIRYWIY